MDSWSLYVQRCFTVVELTLWVVLQWSLRTSGLCVEVVFIAGSTVFFNKHWYVCTYVHTYVCNNYTQMDHTYVRILQMLCSAAGKLELE